MHENDTLILTVVAGIVFAFAFGFAAQKLRVSPLIGYLLAGVLVGPHTPGFIADSHLTPQIAELGIVLLMFGVGLHFSSSDLASVKTIALPGALLQMAAATALGAGFGRFLGLPPAECILFGFALSVASTVVLLRALEDRGEINTEKGKLAVGWLVVEDLIIVLALVLLPLLAAGLANDGEIDLGESATAIAITVAKIAAFVVLMLVVGRRVLPWFLERIADTKSRELFSLGTLALALGVAYVAYALAGASMALGAFFAGLVLNESKLSHDAAERILPLRDAFAVLFFVSVGMLFDPSVLLREPLVVLVVLAIIILGKGLVALAIMAAFRQPFASGLTISASLAQVGEFSFVLAGLGLKFNLMSAGTQDLIVGGALLSIAVNPLVFWLADRIAAATRAPAPARG